MQKRVLLLILTGGLLSFILSGCASDASKSETPPPSEPEVVVPQNDESEEIFYNGKQLMGSGNYLAAIEEFEKIDTASDFYIEAAQNIEQCRGSYITDNLKQAQEALDNIDYEAKDKLVANVLALDPMNQEALALKEIAPFSLDDIYWDASRGNSNANLVNGGRITQKDNTLYYVYYNILQADIDGSNLKIKQKLTYKDFYVEHLIVLDDMLTYLLKDYTWANGKMYHLPTEDRFKGKGGPHGDIVHGLTYYNDKLYFVERLMTDYTVKAWDKNTRTLTRGPRFINGDTHIRRESIYFGNNKVYYVILDGNRTLIEQDLTEDFSVVTRTLLDHVKEVQFENDWAYYVSEKKSGLFRLNLKTGEQEQILKSLQGPFNVNNEYIYYAHDNDIYRIKATPEAKPQKLTREKLPIGPAGDNVFRAIHVLPSGIYAEDTFYRLLRLNSDGSMFDLKDWQQD